MAEHKLRDRRLRSQRGKFALPSTTATCSRCGGDFPMSSMIKYEGKPMCKDCFRKKDGDG